MAPGGYGARVEGLHAVTAAAEAGRVEKLYLERRRSGHPSVGALLTAVGEERVFLVDDVASIATTDSPQGVVAECRPLQRVALDELAGPDAAVMVLDHVEDPHNVGAVARSIVAAGMTGLVVSTRRAAPLSASAFKSAAGALESLRVAIVASIPQALSHLGDLGLWSVGLDASGEENLFGLPLLTEPVALVMGGEGPGLSTLARERCDVVASIPMAEGVESLNVSVSAALAAFEIMRVRRSPPG